MKGLLFLVFVSVPSLVLAASPTWSYDADFQYPNAWTNIFYGSGPAEGTSYVRLGSENTVTYLEVDTASQTQDTSAVWQAKAGTWNVDPAAGYTIEYRIRLDKNAITKAGACSLSASDGSYIAAVQIFNEWGYLAVRAYKADWSYNLATVGGPYDWHTYRIDVRNGVADIYVDSYPWPVFSVNLPSATDEIIDFGDGNGPNNGKYQIDYIRTYQNAKLSSPVLPSPTDAGNTLLLAHYNGEEGSAGLDADYAIGSRVATATGAMIDPATAKFGAGSAAISTYMGYQSLDNFNVQTGTVEMWIKPADWTDFGWQGIFGMYYDSSTDIRIQKLNSNILQTYMASNGKSWSITTSSPVNLNDGQWYHFAWTWDMSVTTSSLYIDGQPLTVSLSCPTEGMSYTGALRATMFPGNMQSGSNPFKGWIDEFRVSDKDLYGGKAFNVATAAWGDSFCGDINHPVPNGDLTGDCIVNFQDMAVLASNWLDDNRP